MIDKIKDLLGSIRFYVVSFAWLSEYLSKISADGFDIVVLFNQLALYFGSVVAIGSLDSIATKLSSKKEQ